MAMNCMILMELWCSWEYIQQQLWSDLSLWYAVSLHIVHVHQSKSQLGVGLLWSCESG